MTPMTLFSLIYGEIAHMIKEDMDPFRGIETIVLGLWDMDRDKPSTLIVAKDGSKLRLTVEAWPPTPPAPIFNGSK